jgi:BNR/Asp-box repeat protein
LDDLSENKPTLLPEKENTMIDLLRPSILASLMACTLTLQPIGAFPLAPIIPSDQASQPSETARDGRSDFDFNIGVWHTHIQRITDPLSGSANAVVLDGTVTVRKVWDGRAQLEEIEADGPKGHWEGLTLFLYNPQSHQWSQSFINSKAATLNTPTVGAFKDGRGELFSQDTFNGKSILVRGVWSNITPDSHSYEESYSADGGKTWAPAFIANLTREKQSATSATHSAGGIKLTSAVQDAPRVDGQNDFDFDLGTWKTHSSRLLHPLTGSTTWVDMDGISVVKKVWDGRANLAEYKADGPAGHVELLSLRWFNPDTHEWNLDFATPNVGTFGIPGVGEFKNGRGDFYDYEPINGRSVLVRFSIWKISSDTAQSEQAFSDDGGKTWEVNWINRYTRIKE